MLLGVEGRAEVVAARAKVALARAMVMEKVVAEAVVAEVAAAGVAARGAQRSGGGRTWGPPLPALLLREAEPQAFGARVSGCPALRLLHL